jgi:hypothetical protein
MSTKLVTTWSAGLGCVVALGLGRISSAPPAAQLALDLTTLHAATLSAARNAADSADAPYLLVSVVGSAGSLETHELPAAGHWALRQDGTIGTTPITTLSLQPGDSMRVLLTVLEDRTTSPQELPVATAATKTMADQRALPIPPWADLVAPALAPLTRQGAHWLGSASLLLVNDGGTTYWTSLDCVATCTVLRSSATPGGAGAVLQETTPKPTSGVVELSGASGTYHMQVAVRRVP